MHGRSRVPLKSEKDALNDPQKNEALKSKVNLYSRLQNDVLSHHQKQIFTPEAILQSSKLLELNPDIYSVWNYRKCAFRHRLSEAGEDKEAIAKIAKEDLKLVEVALHRNPKSYGAWHHRKWIVNQGLADVKREFLLIGHLLKLDERNFHGWDYWRFASNYAKSGVDSELLFAMDKINEEPRNYSAWHTRSILLPFGSSQVENLPSAMAKELDLVHQALWTAPEDQSGFIYFHWLLRKIKELCLQENDCPAAEDSHQVVPSDPLDGDNTPFEWPPLFEHPDNSPGACPGSVVLPPEAATALERSPPANDNVARGFLPLVEGEVQLCRQLMEEETDSTKWPKLALASLLLLQAEVQTQICQLQSASKALSESAVLLRQLKLEDRVHSGFYCHQLSKICLKQLTLSVPSLLPYWWHPRDLHGLGWLRLCHLSLDHLECLEKLLWVQQLDLRGNLIRSLKGIEKLQNLVSLNLNGNLLDSSALTPLKQLPLLRNLSLANNRIGADFLPSVREMKNLQVLVLKGNCFDESEISDSDLGSVVWLNGERI